MQVTTMEFLHMLYPQPMTGRWVLGMRSVRAGHWQTRWLHTLDSVVRASFQRRKTNDIYLAPGLQEPKVALALARSRRARVKLASVPGAASAVLALPALWVELEVARPGETRPGEKDLPPDRASALGLLAAVPIPPSVVVAHGGGFDVYWLLRRPWLLATAEDRAAAVRALGRLSSAVASAASDRGWQLEPEVDLARRLRLPGMLDRGSLGGGSLGGKLGSASKRRRKPVLVSVVRFPLPGEDRRYEPADFDQLPSPPAALPCLPRRAIVLQAQVAPPAALEPVFAGCGWLRRCYATRADLPVKEWRAALGVVGRSETPEADGRALAHWISRGHPGTTRALTDDTLDQALASPSPTCDSIAGTLRASACVTCPQRGKIESPLDLGRGAENGSDRGASDRGATRLGKEVADGANRGATRLGTAAVDEVNTLLGGAEVRIYSADGVLLRAWKPVADPAPGEAAASGTGAVREVGEPVSQQAAVADFVLGLEELLVDIGGSATARKIVERLAATASSGGYRRLRAGLAALDPRWRHGDGPGAGGLGMLLRRFAGESVKGLVIERLHKTYLGVIWQTRRELVNDDPDCHDPDRHDPDRHDPDRHDGPSS